MIGIGTQQEYDITPHGPAPLHFELDSVDFLVIDCRRENREAMKPGLLAFATAMERTAPHLAAPIFRAYPAPKGHIPYDGMPPAERGSATSVAAAESMVKSQRDHQRLILNLMAERGGQGVTDDEGEQITGIKHQSYSAARRGLVLEGKVRKLGTQRRTRSGRQADVYVIVRRG